MKQIVKSLVVASALTAAGSASADWFDCFCPFVGIDYYQVWAKGRGDFGRFLPKSYPGLTVYLGAKFCENLGFELGYDTSTRRSTSFSIPAGTSFGGITANTNVSGSARLRRSGGHIDLVGYWPFMDCFELFGTIGYGWIQPKIDFTSTTALGNLSGLNGLSLRGRSVFRLGIGTNYMLTDCIGARLKLGWESGSNHRFRNATFNGVNFNQRAFRSAFTLAVGVFAKF